MFVEEGVQSSYMECVKSLDLRIQNKGQDSLILALFLFKSRTEIQAAGQKKGFFCLKLRHYGQTTCFLRLTISSLSLICSWPHTVHL
jgi:hypothetical protein